ncbi:hypothetical protein NQ314_009204 [Rhamnusium bicolor]|uniref:Uncharacterized protein n=1 Tax=Rhamnusium bicolor TaxID=1586634 RepID=A0AAV8Y231_9CUCU|nr:hypothetical protein NQ314_009204 [Rhamnusium bicolor]
MSERLSNISRFINHSCDPNAETQKWTVNGELRIGFFSTRTILAGEEVTFDYRFQRYGKEAQKCYCEASICRGWLGERPDEDSEDEDEEEEEEEDVEVTVAEKTEKPTEVAVVVKDEGIKVEKELEQDSPAIPVVVKRKSPRKKPRKDMFEDLDQLDEEIGMLVTTGLKNQAHTLKLSRLMVRAKEPAQRTKLLRILRRGELPCRRLFLDYHGLRLMHGYMIDAQHLVHTDKKYESLRLEMLQTLAVLPIPNKTMLQDSKVLPTVEKWSTDKDLGSPQDSDSNSPKNEQDGTQTPADDASKEKNKEPQKKTELLKKEDEKPERSIEDQEEEIRFLATKLLEGWTNLKEVFRIPKKERIEQMKEHEREANKKFMQSGYGGEQDSSRKSDRYRHLSRYKMERDSGRKGSKSGDKPSAEFMRLSKIERRKLFALQHELKEEERRLKQREMWRQHELNCLIIGTDPRFTAPFDPNRGYQCIWNPQIGQWQNYPLPPQNQTLFSPQPPTSSNIQLPSLPNLNVPPPQLQIPKSIPNFPYASHIGIPTSLNGGISQLSTNIAIAGPVQPPPPTSIPQIHIQQQMPNLQAAVSQINSMQGIPGALPQNIPTHPQYQEQVQKEEDPLQVKFMGPIPAPVKLPPKWKCAKDKYGRPYYYHIRLRKSQWEPPQIAEIQEDPEEESSESDSSSETSSVSSDTSSDNSDSDDDIDDTRLLLEVRKQMEISAKLTLKPVIPEHVKIEEISTPSPDDKNSDDNDIEIDEDNDMSIMSSFIDEEVDRPSIDIRLKEQFDLLKDDKPPRKKRRLGLCEEIIISPRSEEDRLQFREDLKRYKANKERLKRQKDLILQQTRKQLREIEPKKSREKRSRTTLKSRIKEMPDFNSENAKKIKENFRSNMASTVVDVSSLS